jgi:hypothetical protein
VAIIGDGPDPVSRSGQNTAEDFPVRRHSLSAAIAVAPFRRKMAAEPTAVQGFRFPMSDTPPDRLSVNPKSRFHDADLLARGIGIRFNGKEKTNVEEYCVSEGWVRMPAGKALDRFGNPMTIKMKGQVEAYFRAAE